MSDLEELCDVLNAIRSEILRTAQDLNSKARSYSGAAANAAAAGRSAGGEAHLALTRTATAFSVAATCCRRAAELLVSASNEAGAFVARTVGGGGSAGAAGIVGSSGADPTSEDGADSRQGPGTEAAQSSWRDTLTHTVQAALTTLEIVAVTATGTAAGLEATNLPVSLAPTARATISMLADANEGLEAGADAYKEGLQIGEDIDKAPEVTTSQLVDPPSWLSEPTSLEASINADLAAENVTDERAESGGPSSLLS